MIDESKLYVTPINQKTCKHEFSNWNYYLAKNNTVAYSRHCNKCGAYDTHRTEIQRYRYFKLTSNLQYRPFLIRLTWKKIINGLKIRFVTNT